MSNQRARRVPSFQGNDRLKFTAEEQQAIRDAERASGYQSRPRNVAGPRARPRHRLALAIILTLGFLFLPGLIVSVLNSIRSQESVAEREMQVNDAVQPQSRTILNNSTVEFQNESASEASRDIASPETIPLAGPFHEQGQPNQPPRPSGTISGLPVDEGGRIIFVNE